MAFFSLIALCLSIFGSFNAFASAYRSNVGDLVKKRLDQAQTKVAKTCDSMGNGKDKTRATIQKCEKNVVFYGQWWSKLLYVPLVMFALATVILLLIALNCNQTQLTNPIQDAHLTYAKSGLVAYSVIQFLAVLLCLFFYHKQSAWFDQLTDHLSVVDEGEGSKIQNS